MASIDRNNLAPVTNVVFDLTAGNGERVTVANGAAARPWDPESTMLPTDPEQLRRWFSISPDPNQVGDSYALRITRQNSDEIVKLWMQGVVLERQLRDEGGAALYV